jgi:hypothetical protein
MPRFRLRTLLIVLAIGLALLQFAIFLIPYDVEKSEGTAWFLCLDFFSYVVPVVQISALAIALTIRDDSSSNIQSHAPILRFTIRDLLWLMVVVGMGVTVWITYRKMEAMAKEIKVWEYRAFSLRNDMLTGTNKDTDIEFIPGGIQYTGKKSN